MQITYTIDPYTYPIDMETFQVVTTNSSCQTLLCLGCNVSGAYIIQLYVLEEEFCFLPGIVSCLSQSPALSLLGFSSSDSVVSSSMCRLTKKSAFHSLRSLLSCKQFFICVSCGGRSEEHTSELQSRPHISYAVFCLKKKKKKTKQNKKTKKKKTHNKS